MSSPANKLSRLVGFEVVGSVRMFKRPHSASGPPHRQWFLLLKGGGSVFVGDEPQVRDAELLTARLIRAGRDPQAPVLNQQEARTCLKLLGFANVHDNGKGDQA